jgi:hypothetical protein
MILSRIDSTRRTRPRRRLRLALLLIAAVPLAGYLYYGLDEAPSGIAQSVSARPARSIPDVDNAWIYLTGIGASADVDPVRAGRSTVDAYLADAPPETIDAEAVPEVRPDPERDGFASVCRPSLGHCSTWAAQHRDALQRLVDANRLRLSRLDTAMTLTQWQESPIRSQNMPPTPAATVRLHFAALALRASAGEDPVALGEVLARDAEFWRRASEQADWLLSKMLAVMFLADSQRLLVEIYADATLDQRRALDPVVDSTLAPPSAAMSNLDVYAYDVTQMSAVAARSVYPGLGAALRRCWHGAEPQPAAPPQVAAVTGTCGEQLVDAVTFRPQATANRLAPFADAARTLLAATPAGEAEAQRRFDERYASLRSELHLAQQWLPVYNESGIRFVLTALDTPGPALRYRQRLNDVELLRRLLLIRVSALRANVAEAGMIAFLDTLPATLRHPYPEKTIRWDAVRGAFTAPTAVEGIFDEDGLVMSYRR